MLIDTVRQTIRSHDLIHRGDHIVLGLSGGPDSACLFHVLLRLAEELSLTIHPVHVNHQFRPGAAERDQAYVESLCAKAGLACHSFIVDVNAMAKELGMTSEEAGRKARYDAFVEVAREVARGNARGGDLGLSTVNAVDWNEADDVAERSVSEATRKDTARGADDMNAAGEVSGGEGTDERVMGGSAWTAREDTACRMSEATRVVIAVAQNANDQAETILHRILRGTGTDGLSGIAYKRFERGIPVIRPLLDVPREDIEAYCQENHLNPVIDHTNSEPIYTRNRIRLQVLPLLEEYNPNLVGTLARLARIAAADKEYLWQQAEQAYRQLRDDSRHDGRIGAAGRDIRTGAAECSMRTGAVGCDTRTGAMEGGAKTGASLSMRTEDAGWDGRIGAAESDTQTGAIGCDTRTGAMESGAKTGASLSMRMEAVECDLQPEQIILDRARLAALPEAVRRRVITRAFGDIGLTSDISEERLRAADAIISKKQAPKTVQFPRGYSLTVQRGQVYFRFPGVKRR